MARTWAALVLISTFIMAPSCPAHAAATTYTNPVRTTKLASLYTAIEKPVLIPLMYLTIAAWPLVWVMDWLGYLNGSAHRSTKRPDWEQGSSDARFEALNRLSPTTSRAIPASSIATSC